MENPITLMPDLQQAKRFLNALCDGEAVTFQTFSDKGKNPLLAKVLHGTVDEHWRQLASLNAQGAGVFVTVNRTDGKGRKLENIIAVRAVFVDLDGSPLTPVELSDPSPSIIVHSSPGRYHAYWVTQGIALSSFESIQKQLAQRFGGDPSVHDLPRVMRLPGFYHRKGNDAFLTEIIEIGE